MMRTYLIGLLMLAASSAWGSDWATVSTEKGRRIELDRASVLMSDAGTRVAWGRVTLSDGEADAAGYKMVKALNRYDCRSQTFITVKRAYLDASGLTLREEKAATDRPIAIQPGTLDDRFYRAVCKPATLDQLRQVAQSAAGKAHGDTAEPAVRARHADLKTAREEAPPPAESGPLAKPADKHRHIDLPAKPAAQAAEAPVVKAMPAPYRRPHARPRTHAAPAHAPTPSAVHVHDVHWGYEGEAGPQNWARLKPEYALCGAGTRQSPIDIREGLRVDLDPIRFDYKPTYFRIVDNGHTIQVTVGEGLTLTVMGRTYELQQFHFHRPAEERIDGQRFDMVVHLVHKDYDGRLAVLAILLDRGEAHPLIQTLWNNLPLEKNEPYTPQNVTINPADLLPEQKAYYTYMGSLTTPPCSEGVLWMVMKQPATLSAEQIGVFSRFYRNNARPVQSISGRTIKESR